MVRSSAPHRSPAILASLGVLAAIYLLHLSQLLGWWPRHLVGDALAGLIYVPVFLGSGGLILAISRHTAEAGMWRLISGGTLLWGVGQLVYVALGDSSGTVSPADAFFLALPVCFLAAFWRSRRRWPALPHTAERLDLAALVISLAGYLWFFLLAAQFQNPTQPTLSNVVSNLYPLSDLLLLTLLLSQAWRSQRGAPRGIWLLVTGMLGFITADLGFIVLTLRGVYDGDQWPDALWPLAALLFAAAAVQSTRAARPARAPGKSAPRSKLLLRFAPYAALIASFALTLSLHDLSALAPRGALVCTFIVALLVAARQTLALNELEVRSDELQDSRTLLLHRAHHDPLTGLGNRAHLIRTLEPLLAAAAPTGLVQVDLDNFKYVNDALGHRVGDLLLQEIARRLQEVVCAVVGMPVDRCVRLGSDEFVLVLSPANEQGLEDLCRRVASALREPVALADQRLQITASLGAALATTEIRDAEMLLRWSDLAMYEVKRSGKDAATLYRHGHHEQLAARRLLIESRLRSVLERGGLSLHYQPQRERGGEHARFEALLRWNDELLGPVSPAEFVPIAETAGLMVALDNWVVDEACRQLAQWRPRFPTRQVAVNISPPHLVRMDFLPTLRAALTRHGVPPQALELEVTERLLIEDGDQTRATLRALLDMGVDVAIDDFGVGHSSLAALLNLPISTLKIDRAFVHELRGAVTPPSGEPQDAACKVVQAIVALGQALGLRVVAEGVETSEQAELLWTMGVDALQGYWIGRPTPTGTPELAGPSILPPVSPIASTSAAPGSAAPGSATALPAPAVRH